MPTSFPDEHPLQPDFLRLSPIFDSESVTNSINGRSVFTVTVAIGSIKAPARQVSVRSEYYGMRKGPLEDAFFLKPKSLSSSPAPRICWIRSPDDALPIQATVRFRIQRVAEHCVEGVRKDMGPLKLREHEDIANLHRSMARKHGCIAVGGISLYT